MASNHGSQVAPKTVWTVGFHLLLMGLIVLFLYAIRKVIVMVTVATFLAAVFNPLVVWMERHRVRRWVGVLLLALIVALALGATIAVLVPMVATQAQNLAEALPQLVDKLRAMESIRWADAHFGLLERLRQEAGEHMTGAAGGILEVLTSALHVTFDAGVTLILAIFILIFGGEVFVGILGLLQPSQRFHYTRLAQRMQRTVGGYVAGTVIIALIGGVIISVALLWLGVPFFLPLGAAMFILGLVPFIGPIVAGVVIIGTTLAAKGAVAGLIIAAVFLGYHVLESDILQPLVQRRTIKMNPFIILLALLIGVELAGVLGAVLALPVAGAVQAALKDVLIRRSHGPIPKVASQTLPGVDDTETRRQKDEEHVGPPDHTVP